MDAFLRGAPFVGIAGAFAAGIWFAAEFPTPSWLAVAVAALAGCVALAASGPSRAGGALAALAAAGAARHAVSLPPTLADSLTRANGYSVVLEGVLVDEPDARADGARLRVRVRRVVIEGAGAPDYGPALGVGDLALIRVDASVAWRYGDVVRAIGQLDAPPTINDFDYRGYLAQRGVRSWMPRADRADRVGSREYESLPLALVLEIKRALRASSQAIMPAPESALLAGILIGDDSGLPQHVVTAFKRTGTSHIVAISGFNVSILIALFVLLLSRFMHKRRVALVAIPAIAVYTVLVGASASVVRAAVMAILSLIGLIFWRRGFSLNTLCAAAALILAVNPATLFDIGFQLSFSSTAGLILYADRLSRPMDARLSARLPEGVPRRLAGAVGDALLTTVAATLTTLPLMLTYFEAISVVALPTNVLILWMQPAAMVLGMIASVAGVASAPVGAALGVPAYALLSASLRVVEALGALPFASIPVYAVGTPLAMAYYAGLLALTSPSPGRLRAAAQTVKKHLLGVTGAIACAVCVTLAFIAWVQRPDGRLHVTFTGSSAFAQTPEGRQIVFAGAGLITSMMGRAMPAWDKQVELLIMPQRSDRLRGAVLPVLRQYRADVLALPAGDDEPTQMLDDWALAVRLSVNQLMTAPIGSRIEIEPGLAVEWMPRDRGELGARLIYRDVVFDLSGESGVISGTQRGADVALVNPRQRDAVPVLNAAAPRWVVWSDTGATPRGLAAPIKSLSLRDAGAIEFVTDGRSITLNR